MKKDPRFVSDLFAWGFCLQTEYFFARENYGSRERVPGFVFAWFLFVHFSGNTCCF